VGGRAHTPLSPFPGGEWGRGVRAGAHTPLPGNLFIYSFIQFTQKSAAFGGEYVYSKERRAAFLDNTYFITFILKRAPQYHVFENGIL